MDYTCKQCGKTFKFQYELIVHRAWHKKITVKDVNFQCPLCLKTLSRKNHLKDHIRLIHTRGDHLTKLTT